MSRQSNLEIKSNKISKNISKTISINDSDTNNFQLKKADKNRKQIELKSKIDIPISDYTKLINNEKFQSKKTQLNQISPRKKILESQNDDHNSQNRKNHKKTLSEVPKSLNNFESSDGEDVPKISSAVVPIGKKIPHSKITKFINLKKKNELASTSKNYDSFNEFNENDLKITSNENYDNGSFSKIERNIKGSSRDNKITRNVFGDMEKAVERTNTGYKEKYEKTYYENDLGLMIRNCNEYEKSFKILSSIILIQKKEIEKFKKEIEFERKKYEILHKNFSEEQKKMNDHVNQYKIMILKIFNKASTQKTTELENSNAIYSQLIKENEYLRSIITNVSSLKLNLDKVIPRGTNEKQIETQNQQKKKGRRHPTEINLDIIAQEIIEEDKKNEDEVESGLDEEVDKLVKEFKITKKNQTMEKNSKAKVDQANLNIKNKTNISEPISTNVNDNYMVKKLDSSQTNIKPRQQYLFFKTPNNEDKKKFEFPPVSNENPGQAK